jgi:hypothetical protein
MRYPSKPIAIPSSVKIRPETPGSTSIPLRKYTSPARIHQSFLSIDKLLRENTNSGDKGIISLITWKKHSSVWRQASLMG